MSQMSNFLENALIDHIFRATAYTAPATLYVALLTSAPSDTSTGATIAEITGDAFASATAFAEITTAILIAGATSGSGAAAMTLF